MSTKQKIYLILAVFLGALVFRLILIPLGNHVDMLSNAGWGRWIYKNGPLGFYSVEYWLYSPPTQPPLLNLLMAFSYWGYIQTLHSLQFINNLIPPFPSNVVLWWEKTLFEVSDYLYGFMMWLKVPAVLADLGLGMVIFLLAKKECGIKKGLMFACAFLFNPFSWYISSLWGQFDQIGCLFLLLSFMALLGRWLFLAPALFVLSIELKPTSLIFIPFFIWIYFKQKPSLKEIVFGILSALTVYVYLLFVFAHENPLGFTKDKLIPKIFFKSEFRVSTNSFNFWHILIGNKALNYNTPFLFVPAKIWGYLIFIYLNILAFKENKKINALNLFTGLFIIGAGSFLFVTNMLERYFFPGVVFLLILSIYRPYLIKYFLITSIIFWINLFNGWWYPPILDFLKQILVWQDGFVTRILSLLNVLVFLKIVWQIRHKSEKD